MTKQITVTIKEIYGRKLVYPICDEACLLAKLSRMKTFDPTSLRILKELGYELKTIQAFTLDDGTQ